MALPKYFIGAGDVKLAKLHATTGLPLAFWDMGETPQIEWDASIDFADSYSTGKAGPNLQNLHVPIKRSGVLSLVAEEKIAQNLEYFFGGDKTTENAGSYTANGAFPSGILAGEEYLIPGDHVGISSVVIKDSAGSPATLTLGTHYTVNGDAGLIKFVNLGSFVQPFTAFSYSYSASTIVEILGSTPAEVAVLFDGINLAQPSERIWALFDRIALASAEKIAFKAGSSSGTSNTVQAYDLKGPAMLRLDKTAADGYGKYREY